MAYATRLRLVFHRVNLSKRSSVNYKSRKLTAMRFFNLFQKTKHKQFKYYPRYYDEEREELLERVRKAQGSQSNDIDDIKVRISKGFKSGGKSQIVPNVEFRRRETRKSNRMVVYVFLVLVLLTLVFLL